VSHDTIETKSLLKAAREQLGGLNEKLNAITREGFKKEDGGIVVSETASAEFKSLMAQAREVQDVIGGLEGKSRIEDYLNAPAGQSLAAQQQAAMQQPTAVEYKSLGQRFVESAEFKDRKASGAMNGTFEVSDVELTAAVQYKDLYSGSIGTFTHPGFGTVERAPVVAAPMRQARVRDLFPSASTTSVMIEYVQELGFVNPGDNAAATVAERTNDNSNFGLKPKSNINFGTKSTPIKTIAHWIPAHRNTLDDEPTLRNIVDTRLMYGLRLEEDAQLLLGDGQGENLLGILNTDNIQIYPGAATPVTGDTYIDAIRRATTRVVLANYEATGVVVHPYDWERMELTKDSMGRYVAAVSVTTGAQRQLWQLPVVATPVIPEGTALVGAFGLGAQIYDRMQSNIRTADQHMDFFVRNAIVVLAEERLGLAVFRPESMVKVDLQHSTG
jgi:HK97 family phage major capsid protein